MVQGASKKTVAYGEWDSPISQHLVTAGSKSFTQPRVSANGRIFFAETRVDGGNTIVEVKGRQQGHQAEESNLELVDVLPPEYSASNAVYSYGGSVYEALADGRLIFSNGKDKSLCVLDPDTRTVSQLVQGNPALEYCNFSANHTNPWVLAIQEDHRRGENPENVLHRIVAVNADTGEVKTVREGADFYYQPEMSRDGTRLAWIEWDHPDMPWYAGRLNYALFRGEDAASGPARLVAGGLLHGVAEPHWGPDGSLFFGMESMTGSMSDCRQLFRLRPGEMNVEHVTFAPDLLAKAEFGEMNWGPNSRSYVPLSGKTLVAAAQIKGISRLIAIDLEDKSWKDVATQDVANQMQMDCLTRIDDTRVLGIFSGQHSTPSVWIVDAVETQANELISKSQELPRDISPSKWFSEPELLSIPSKLTPGSRTVSAFLWMPRNPEFQAPADDALPPLIIATHGGPTGNWGPGLRLRTQYFTTRGYAVVLLNYHGSTAHGRRYRQALWSRWGEIDADDAAEVAAHLVDDAHRIRPGAVGITGLSAGGYHTLVSIYRHPHLYAGAVCISGICDLESFDATTHKLEWHYTEALVLGHEGAGTITKEERRDVYYQRSALHHTDVIETPLLILHATEDLVVPMEQATQIYDALQARDKDVKLVKVEGDGHSLAKPRSAKIWLDEEEKWWKKTLTKLHSQITT